MLLEAHISAKQEVPGLARRAWNAHACEGQGALSDALIVQE